MNDDDYFIFLVFELEQKMNVKNMILNLEYLGIEPVHYYNCSQNLSYEFEIVIRTLIDVV